MLPKSLVNLTTNQHLVAYFDHFVATGSKDFPDVSLLKFTPLLVTKGGQHIPVTGAGKGKPRHFRRTMQLRTSVPRATRPKPRAICTGKEIRDGVTLHAKPKDKPNPKSSNSDLDEPLSPILSSSMQPDDPCTRCESDSDSDSDGVSFHVPTQKSKILKKAC